MVWIDFLFAMSVVISTAHYLECICFSLMDFLSQVVALYNEVHPIVLYEDL